MPVLKPDEYNMFYFDGKKGSYHHNAGYTKYQRHYRETSSLIPIEECTGEFFKDLAKKLFTEYKLKGKKVLDLGSAYGFMVEDLRELGVNAYGIDVSQYAYDQASKAVKPYITVADVRSHLKTFKEKEWDFIISRWFLGSISDDDLPSLIGEMNRVSKKQIHIISSVILPDYYNRKPINEWLKMDFSKGTVLISSEKIKKVHTK